MINCSENDNEKTDRMKDMNRPRPRYSDKYAKYNMSR